MYQSADIWKEFNLIVGDSIYIATGLPKNPLYGYVQGHGCYSKGDTAVLTVQSYEGYEFFRWSDGNTDNPRNVIISQDTTLVAEYSVSKYHLTLTCDEEQGTINGTSGEYDYGTTHTFSATPNTSFYFVQWSDGNTDNPRTIVLTQDTTITAIFATQTFMVTFANDNDTILSSQEYEYGAIPIYNGTTPTKTEDEKYTYMFKGWTPEIVPVVEDATYTATYIATKKTEAIDSVTDAPITPIRYMDNGNVYILMPDGKKYSILGELVK